jgi:Tol biopolymer transport system component
VSRLTDDGRSQGPVWTPDGKRVAFTTFEGSQSGLNAKAVEGGSIDRLTTRPNAAYAQSWMPDGSALAFTEMRPETSYDVWVLPLSGDRRPVPILTSRFSENHAEFSPDGRWLAYTSTESGRAEVFVRSYPEGGAGQPVSTEGGNSPAWSRDGTELFFTTLPTRDGTIKMMVVPVTTTGSAVVRGTPRALFEGRYNSNNIYRQYDISKDAKRFLMLRHMDRAPLKPTQMILVQHWFEELKRLVPTQ